MGKHLLLAVVVVMVGATASDITACGDKFLVPSRGIRFQIPPLDRESAMILLYAGRDSALGIALKKLSVEEALRRAGYRPTTVVTADEFDATLRAARWDVVVVELANGPHIAQRLTSAPAPIVLPVVFASLGADMDDAKKQYRHILKTPKKDKTFLEAVDKVIAERAKARRTAPTKSSD